MSDSASKLNDIELQRIRRKVPDLSVESLKALVKAVEGFRNSPRYLFFQHMTLREFFSAEETESSLRDHSFGDLVQMKIENLCSIPGMQADEIERLVVILNQLVEGDHSESEAVGESFAADISALILTASERRELPEDDPNIPRYGSIEAESKLTHAFLAVRSAAAFGEIQKLRVERYWDTELGRAPFLEPLTFRELVGLSVDDLLKKRSFGNRKIHGILTAIDRCLKDFEEAGVTDLETLVETEAASPESSLPQTEEAPRMNTAAELPALPEDVPLEVHLLLRGAYQILTDPAVAGNALLPLLRKCLERENPAAMVPWIAGGSDEPPISRELVSEVARDTVAETLTSWQQLLTSPAVHESVLLPSQSSDEVVRELEARAGRLLLFGLGAVHPEYEGSLLSSCWTTNIRAFQVLIEGLLMRLPLPEEELKNDLEALLPHVEASELLIFIQPLVTQDSSGLWQKK